MPGNTSDHQNRRVPLRAAVAVFIGNGLEFYDFLTYSYFAVYIGRSFFPAGDPSVSLLASLAAFGAGFLTRPIGAVVIGGMGDRIGRRPAMLLSFSLMGAALLGFALTPSYARIGSAAPVLVLFFRLVQGFALGGEVGPTTAYMAEAAPVHRRGLYLSMQYATQDAAALCAGIAGVALAAALTPAELQDWGWRVAMLIGVAIVPFGLLMRRRLPETLERSGHAQSSRLRSTLRPYALIVILGLIMIGGETVGSYASTYMTTYALTTLGRPADAAFGLAVLNGSVSIVSELFSGWLSDRVGRKPVMLSAAIGLLVVILPGFWAINHFQSVWVLYGADAAMVFFGAVSSVPVIVTLTESLPPAIRSGAVATIYAVAVAIFGGSTQFMLAFLIRITGNPLMPGFYWAGAAMCMLVAMAIVRESAPGVAVSKFA